MVLNYPYLNTLTEFCFLVTIKVLNSYQVLQDIGAYGGGNLQELSASSLVCPSTNCVNVSKIYIP